MNIRAMAEGMGAKVTEKTVTELLFPSGRKLILEDLSGMQDRDVMVKLLEMVPAGITYR